jgi:hypothetical protein
MKRVYPLWIMLFIAMLIAAAPAVYSQNGADAARDKTRERLSALLARVGPELNVNFQPSSKSQYVFTGSLKQGLANCDSMEIVVSVTNKETIGFRIYPHYKGAYINVDKARNATQLLRQIAQLNESTFLFWGVDETGDVFTGYTVTLESGFPDESIKIVLSSIKNSDQFVGQMRPSIDGTNAL